MSTKRRSTPAAPAAKTTTAAKALEAVAKPQPQAAAPTAKSKSDPYEAKMAAMTAMELAARQNDMNELRDLVSEFKRIATNADLMLMVRLLRTYTANQPLYGHDPLLPVAFMEEILARANGSSLTELRPALRANAHPKEEPGISELRQQLTAFILIGLSGARLSRLQEVARLVDIQLNFGSIATPAENFICDAIRAHYTYGGLTLEWLQHEIDPKNVDGFAVNFKDATENRQRWDEMYGGHEIYGAHDSTKEAA